MAGEGGDDDVGQQESGEQQANDQQGLIGHNRQSAQDAWSAYYGEHLWRGDIGCPHIAGGVVETISGSGCLRRSR